MPIGLKRTLTTGSIPVFQISEHPQLAQGGFALDTTGLTADSVLYAGQPFLFDEATRLAKPLHTGVIYETSGASDTVYKVKKGHLFIVGDNFCKTVGNKAYAITAIDTSNASYDSVTVGTTLGTLTAGDFVFASSAAGATAGAFPATLKGLLYSDVKVAAGESCSVAIKATVYARRVPYSADLAATLKGITYSQSF